MKAYEILSEEISLTNLKYPLTKAIHNVIADGLQRIGKSRNNIPLPDKNESIKYGNSAPLTKHTDDWMRYYLKTGIQDAVTAILREALGTDKTQMNFAKMKSNGEAEGLIIRVNEDHVSKLLDPIMNDVYDNASSNFSSDESVFDEYFKSFTEYNEKKVTEIYNLERPVRDLVSVIVHEAVHGAQHQAQFKKGRDRTEYRSYLEKDKGKFYKAVDNIVQSRNSDNDLDMYKASPQEIAAFAHQAALDFIEDTDADGNFDIEYVRDMMQDSLPGYLDKRFHQPDDPKRYKIFKRFSKLVYQEVSKYLERLIAQQNKSD